MATARPPVPTKQTLLATATEWAGLLLPHHGLDCYCHNVGWTATATAWAGLLLPQRAGLTA